MLYKMKKKVRVPDNDSPSLTVGPFPKAATQWIKAAKTKKKVTELLMPNSGEGALMLGQKESAPKIWPHEHMSLVYAFALSV